MEKFSSRCKTFTFCNIIKNTVMLVIDVHENMYSFISVYKNDIETMLFIYFTNSFVKIIISVD